jgi:hypothetical protein
MKLSLDKKRIRLYLGIGAAYLAVWLLIDALNTPESFFKRVVNNLWLISYLVILNFILYEYTLPFIKFTWKRLLVGSFLIWALLMLYSFGLYAWRSTGIHLSIYTALRNHPSVIVGVQYHAPYSFFSVFFFGVIRYTYDHRKLKRMAQQLRIEKQEAELNYLKSQTNPHFLFNTLNNIYALARDKSDLAPEAILRLSKILRFMLYEAGSAYSSIEQELKIIDDYIALERLRYDESLRLAFTQDVEEMRQALPPLLLMPLVENAFKHGASETRGQPFVDIHLSVKQRRLTFVVKNSTGEEAAEKEVRENIGLSNLRRQLELLYTDYALSVQQEKDRFIATLHINLASHV